MDPASRFKRASRFVRRDAVSTTSDSKTIQNQSEESLTGQNFSLDTVRPVDRMCKQAEDLIYY